MELTLPFAFILAVVPLFVVMLVVLPDLLTDAVLPFARVTVLEPPAFAVAPDFEADVAPARFAVLAVAPVFPAVAVVGFAAVVVLVFPAVVVVGFAPVVVLVLPAVVVVGFAPVVVLVLPAVVVVDFPAVDVVVRPEFAVVFPAVEVVVCAEFVVVCPAVVAPCDAFDEG